jgi:hypothetical protein
LVDELIDNIPGPVVLERKHWLLVVFPSLFRCSLVTGPVNAKHWFFIHCFVRPPALK